MDIPVFLAIVISLGAAVANASMSLFIRKGSTNGKAVDAVFVVIGVNIVVLLPLVLLVYYPDYGLTRTSWIAFIAAGIFGTVLGRMCKFTSIHRIGASRTEPIVAAHAIIATVLGVIILGESLSPVHALGIALIVGGVSVIAWETSSENSEDLSQRQVLLGILLPLGGAVAYGWEPILASIGFAEGTPAPVGLIVKTVAASIGFTMYLRWHNAVPSVASLRSPNMRWFILAGIANTLFILGYYVALELAPVNVVVPVITTNTLFVVLLSAIFMPRHLERVTWTLIIAATIVVVGVLMITTIGSA
ncbi:EamA family transporter [Saliphagus sp. GCM10025334]